MRPPPPTTPHGDDHRRVVAARAHAAASQGFAAHVVRWQRDAGRHNLPWQTDDPYRVWLSEVMLQQTQVSTVLAYYARFLQRFPTVADLAAAPLDDVLAAWSGLGYYRRARFLHRCAQVVMRDHAGRFPTTRQGLQTLPGIGRSTAAAIAAFCFGERTAILDGNVKRVLARLLGFGEDLARGPAVDHLWAQADVLLPPDHIGRYTQGLMDLGAQVCLPRKPRCTACPVATMCVARTEGRVDAYPVKSRALRRGTRESVWLWLQHHSRVMLVQRPAEGVWASLWSLPEFNSFNALAAATQGWPGYGEALPSSLHVLTHLDWTLHPRRWYLPDDAHVETFEASLNLDAPIRWVTPSQALTLGLPVPWRRLFGAAQGGG